MADAGFDRGNRESRDRLVALASLISPDQLGVDVGDGWTVATVLAHLAFWDRWQVARWRDAEAHGLQVPADMPDLAAIVNVALEPILAAVSAENTSALAMAAAMEVDSLVAGLPEASVRGAVQAGRGRLVDRAVHRLEHVAQIERALEPG